MKHRIVVLGAGYAGAFSATFMARQLHSDDFEITVVNAEPDFVERLRLHQLAAGQQLRYRPLAKVFAGTGIRLRIARVTGIDAEQRTVTVTGDDGLDRIEYDTLLYALGSTIADHGVPGVDEHTYHVAARPAALRLHARLDELNEGGTVLVVGGNLTAIEAVTELAESRPGLRVGLVTRGELGGRLGSKARRHMQRAFDRLGIQVHEHTPIAHVEEAAAIAADGTAFAADAIVWAAGFAVPPIAAASGLAVEPNGQITVDRQMRSVSHPDIYAAGDSVFVIGDNGLPYPMSCASAGPTSKAATASIIGHLTGRKVAPTTFSYIGNHISLGRNDGLFQLVDADARAKPSALRGRAAARVKSAIIDTAAWAVSHPTFGKPSHKYHLVTTRETSPSRSSA
ncbi:FAD-dependent oxidoreductase [Nocardia otitidiscaviarum]|uniref:NAD(P)/FAD-dependent oxidoreductase n=1 Tax=Nocardia otitidiscaviarum TaxID=1823 RepID=UPI0004A725DD|nr:FAD-dependent oxidoreductase [Nocardia otitidiscaviarum]MBF6132167.1 FAD-dependent oxidoreductase [Nocardia otitidiscaviarum]MBF6483297.1 FAD-dependent oxidoreductase [Nocardia otitidiscaviarum]